MITGAHFLLYSRDADADRAFVRDVLGFRAVDAGGGWLIFALPPSELAVHPGPHVVEPDAGGGIAPNALYLMCDDLGTQVADLAARGVTCAPAGEAPWGRWTTFALPSGARFGLYQPTHVTAIAAP